MQKLAGPTHFELAGGVSQDLLQMSHISFPLFIYKHFSFAFCSFPGVPWLHHVCLLLGGDGGVFGPGTCGTQPTPRLGLAAAAVVH